MKKTLLLAAMALTAAAPSFAADAKTDGFKYETKNGITCHNRWIDDRTSNLAGWNALPFTAQATYARTACLGKYQGADVVIVGYSPEFEPESGGDVVGHAQLVIIDFSTGALVKLVQMTFEGKPITGKLAANQVGCDQFGNVWFAGYVPTTYNSETQRFTPLTIYHVTDLENGICEKAAELVLPDDETDAVGRIDYCDLVGDVTRKEAGCCVMAALADPADKPYVLAWAAEQGSDKWEGAMDGYTSTGLTDTYPADQTKWGTAPMVRIVLDEDYSNNLFYVDGFTTCPSLYDNSGAMLESFAAAVELAPKTGTNGVGEFTLAGKDFIAYSVCQYDVTPGCTVNVCELGEGQSFDGMELYWTVPTNGLGELSDGGTRIHAVETLKFVDSNGKEGVYLLTYKSNNGLGVYVISEEGWVDPNGDGGANDIVADDIDYNAPVEFFNLNGASVKGDNLTPGLYITRQGSKVNKVVVK